MAELRTVAVRPLNWGGPALAHPIIRGIYALSGFIYLLTARYCDIIWL